MYQIKKFKEDIGFAKFMSLVCFAILFGIACRVVNFTVEEVHRRIRSELPSGSSYSQVEGFLKKYDWGGSGLREIDRFGTLYDMLTEEEEQKIKKYSSGGIREAEKRLLGGKGILDKTPGHLTFRGRKNKFNHSTAWLSSDLLTR